MREKSMVLTYFLWLVGGMFGLHHFYLGRDIQGFLWWCTLGGYMGFGWLRDIFHIPEYVADANEDPQFMAKLTFNLRTYEKPPFSSLRFSGMIFVGYLWSSIVSLAIPQDAVAGYSLHWLHMFIPLACALGVWSVGNIGREEGRLSWCLAAAYAVFPLYYFYDSTDLSFLLMVFVSAFAFDMKSKKWRRRIKSKKSVFRRTLVLAACALLYLSLWASYLYFNAKVQDADGDEVPLHEAVHHFFTSPWWTDLKESLVSTWEFARANGWTQAWQQIVELSDPHGEQNAYKVLGLSMGVNQTVINSQCRMLSMKWHPDKVKDPDEKLTAQQHFYEVQKACDLLSTNKANRRRKIKKLKQNTQEDP